MSSLTVPYKFIRLDGNSCDVDPYEEYKDLHAHSWPDAAKTYALSSGHLDPSSQNWIHDAWLKEIKIENSIDMIGSYSGNISFLGPRHDRIFNFYYKNVIKIYSNIFGTTKSGDCDLIADELTFDQTFRHVFVMSNRMSVVIEFLDFLYIIEVFNNT